MSWLWLLLLLLLPLLLLPHWLRLRLPLQLSLCSSLHAKRLRKSRRRCCSHAFRCFNKCCLRNSWCLCCRGCPGWRESTKLVEQLLLLHLLQFTFCLFVDLCLFHADQSILQDLQRLFQTLRIKVRSSSQSCVQPSSSFPVVVCHTRSCCTLFVSADVFVKLQSTRSFWSWNDLHGSQLVLQAWRRRKARNGSHPHWQSSFHQAQFRSAVKAESHANLARKT
mmetsp:Transcript_100188/g.198709  ORF Transcript_100188/g.198709 Transcript_100188/m.198709 type:complete len:222 (+) Transcript_100188:701-1366(+)